MPVEPADLDTAGECRALLQSWMADGSFDQRLPEVAQLRGVPQPEEFHAEGDAFTHTMLALAQVDDADDRRVFWGVLLHDIGKWGTTSFVDGRWRAHGHDRVGAGMAAEAMRRLGMEDIAEEVVWLVRNHLFRFSWNLRQDSPLTNRQRRFTGHPLFPLLLKVCAADAAASHSKDGCGGMFRMPPGEAP